jgi:hypothetical protein
MFGAMHGSENVAAAGVAQWLTANAAIRRGRRVWMILAVHVSLGDS